MTNTSNILVTIPTFVPHEVLINKNCSMSLPKEHTGMPRTFKYGCSWWLDQTPAGANSCEVL